MDSANAIKNAPRRLNLVLDNVSFSKLERIKEKHGDSSFTQAIKRAIALLEFIDEKKEEGVELYLSSEEGKMKTLILAP